MSLASDRRLSGSASVIEGAIFLGRDIYSDGAVVGAVRSGATDKLSGTYTGTKIKGYVEKLRKIRLDAN